jgi:hypothetical protein
MSDGFRIGAAVFCVSCLMIVTSWFLEEKVFHGEPIPPIVAMFMFGCVGAVGTTLLGIGRLIYGLLGRVRP